MTKSERRMQAIADLLRKIFRTEPEARSFKDLLTEAIEEEYKDEIAKRKIEDGKKR